MISGRDKVVVIGAGMGGLASAMRLAHAGLDVTLVDSHAAPGGKMRTVDSAAGPVDAGPTVLTMRHVFDRLFADVGDALAAHVTLVPEPVLARHWWPDGSGLDLYADRQASAKAVREFAGSRAEAEFLGFCDSAVRLFDAFDVPMMQARSPSFAKLTAHVLKDPGLIRHMAPLRTLARSLAKQFSDPRLRQLFGRYATYVGGSPFRSPAVLGLIWRAEEQGVWAVQGGMHQLARAMARVAGSQGARLIFGAHAERIEVRDGAVGAVHLADGRCLPAGRVVFNGDPAALTTGLLGGPSARSVPQSAATPRSLSAYVWSFAAKPSGPDLTHHNVFFGSDPQQEFGPIGAGLPPQDPTLYVCAQDRGAGASPDGLERFEIIMNGAPTGTGAPEEPEQCLIRTFETLRRFGLIFDPAPGPEAVTTPAGFARLFPASQGSLYGRSPHGLMAAFRRPTARTRLPGLYLAGGGAHPGAGVPMATLSGAHAAEAILTDLTSTSTSRPTATPGGMSTGSAMTGRARSRSSVS
ncbi:MAG: phytoene desaturase family protein [Rhodobacter sp.]|nr:phytoene desaturase family protein [Rhodobacter sp.]